MDEKNFKSRLQENIQTISELFKGDSILRKREFSLLGVSACLFYFDGMVNVELINESIIKPLVSNTGTNEPGESIPLSG